MKRKELVLAIAAVLGSAAVAGCGDNSKQCGAGTTDVNGVCVGGENVTCEDGTVLVDGACVDPGHIAVDVEEGAEPNGLAVLGEDSANPAGTLSLKAIGGVLVVHGTIVPFQDGDTDGQSDPDIDTYVINVTSPAMINLSADGLHGLSAGFVSLAAVPGLEDWVRFGASTTGDTSKRRLFLPAAGTYVLSVTDSRTLQSVFAGQIPTAAGGDATLPFEYYLSITSEAQPTPTPMTVTAGIAVATGQLPPGDVQLFTVPMGSGINTVSMDAANDAVTESVVITNTSTGTLTVKGVADGDPVGGAPASTGTIGFRTGDTTIIVADHVFNTLPNQVAFTVSVELLDAGALSTTGEQVTQPADDVNFSTFFYDVASDLEITGINIAFKDETDANLPVTGVVVDENFFIFSFFTFDPDFGFFFGDTFQNYKGLMRHFTKGRYYFLVFDSDPNTPATEIRATSTYAPVATTALAFNTPLTAQAPNAFGSNPFNYNAGATAWQLLQATGTGTGNVRKAFFDPGETNFGAPGFGFGRMDPISSTCGVFCEDVVPIFTQVTNAAGTNGGGRILLGDKPFVNLQPYLMNVQTVTGGTYDLNFVARDHTDLGTVAVGTPATATDQPLALVGDVKRYLFRTTAGNGVNILVHPDQVTLNTRIQQRNVDESARGALINNGAIGADDSILTFQSGEGFTAIEVTPVAAVGGGTFDLTVTALAPVTYTASNGTTTFADACIGGGTEIAMADLDDGASAAINVPAGFKYFGFDVTQLKFFANGFLTFDTALNGTFFTNGDIPTAGTPNSMVAAYWDDLVLTDPLDGPAGACQKTVGGKLVLQWRGVRFADPIVPTDIVTFQAILDPATDTIEFVYDVAQVGTGLSATIGIENQIGTAANKLGFNVAGTITPGASKLFTPN